MSVVQLYTSNSTGAAAYQQLDMYGNEEVRLTSSMKNARDISKIYMDYTFSFSVPASHNNNRVFERYYDIYSTGYDARLQAVSKIELDGSILREGRLKLIDTSMKNNKPLSYQVVFTGFTIDLKNLFKEDSIKDLPWDKLNHTKDATNVRTGISSLNLAEVLNPGTGSVLYYPLISKGDYGDTWEQWTGQRLESGTHVAWQEMYPAVKAEYVMQLIEETYDIEFESDLFSTVWWANLFMWCPNELDVSDNVPSSLGTALIFQTRGGTDPDLFHANGSIMFYNIPYSSWHSQDFRVQTTPQAGYTTVDYYVDVYGLNSITFKDELIESVHAVGGGNLDFTRNYLRTGEYVGLAYFYRTTGGAKMVIDHLVEGTIKNNAGTTLGNTTGATDGLIVTDDAQHFSNRVPNVKVINWMKEIFKMFNLVIQPDPVDRKKFTIHTFNHWKTLGKIVNITKYVEQTAHKVLTSVYPRSVQFRFAKGKDLNSLGIAKYRSRPYGDLVYNTQGEEEPVNLELQSSVSLFEGLTDGVDDYSVCKQYDDSAKDVSGGMLFFTTPRSDSADIDLIGFSSAVTACRFSTQFVYSLGGATAVGAMMFEYDFDFVRNVQPVEPESTLSLEFYDDYISSIYSKEVKVHKFTAIMPPSVIRSINLNDTLKIGSNYFNINQMKMDLVANKVEFELLNAIIDTSEIVDTNAPTNPSALVSSLITTTTFTLDWTASVGDGGAAITKYKIHTVISGAEVVTEVYGDATTPAATTVDITGVPTGSLNTWFVTAWDQYGKESAGSGSLAVQQL